MRLAIVGSQLLTRRQMIRAEYLIRNVLGAWYPDVVISGGAEGVDYLAFNVAYDYGYTEELENLIIHRPKNERWEPEGYKERNILIAEDCTHLMCIRDPQSSTYGSGWTADRADHLGRQVFRYEV